MYEVHGWFGLSESPSEVDTGGLGLILKELVKQIDELADFNMVAELRHLNGLPFVTITGHRNRPRSDAARIEDLVRFISGHLPGSWGILYERDDETTAAPSPNAYRVRIMARGCVTERDDPFLSPCRPTIED
jgi:hypothetical protein